MEHGIIIHDPRICIQNGLQTRHTLGFDQNQAMEETTEFWDDPMSQPKLAALEESPSALIPMTSNNVVETPTNQLAEKMLNQKNMDYMIRTLKSQPKNRKKPYLKNTLEKESEIPPVENQVETPQPQQSTSKETLVQDPIIPSLKNLFEPPQPISVEEKRVNDERSLISDDQLLPAVQNQSEKELVLVASPLVVDDAVMNVSGNSAEALENRPQNDIQPDNSLNPLELMEIDERRGKKRPVESTQNPIPNKVNKVMETFNKIPNLVDKNANVQHYARIRNQMRHAHRIRSYVQFHLGESPQLAHSSEMKLQNTHLDQVNPNQNGQKAVLSLWYTMLNKPTD